tara:strand:+ start:655 stop:918 length:264 start_codon:yes stop_codon:yes gene_type:complete
LPVEGNAKAIQARSIRVALARILTGDECVTDAFDAEGIGTTLNIADARFLTAALNTFFPFIALGIAGALSGAEHGGAAGAHPKKKNA